MWLPRAAAAPPPPLHHQVIAATSTSAQTPLTHAHTHTHTRTHARTHTLLLLLLLPPTSISCLKLRRSFSDLPAFMMNFIAVTCPVQRRRPLYTFRVFVWLGFDLV